MKRCVQESGGTEGKFDPVLAMKAYGGSKGTDPLVLQLRTR
jgi:hypothetical protein